MRLRVLLLAGALLVAPLLLAGQAHASNPQIAGLQVALRAYGLYLAPVDGVAGPATAAATRVFQRRVGLTPDGIAGPRTRAALGPLGHPLFGRRHLVRGDFGWDVSVLQFLLHMPAIDGYLGPTTERALRRWQRHARLVPDGIAGPATLTAFQTRTGVPLPLKPKRRARLVVSASPTTVRATLDHWAGHYGVDPSLARALAWMESGYNPNVTSSVGAWGVMQIMPSTWRYVETSLIGRQVPRTAEGNVHVGTALLHHLLDRFDGNEQLALGAWYEGERAVRTNGLYPETKSFVANVLALKRRSL
jgi:peptidoglycan hydrolase-like protein with peptidoglycan-binding domain